MPECTALSDRMPDVLAGRDAWSPADHGHLAGCRDCAAEWSLVRRAGSLGDELGYAPDARAVTGAVLSRLAAARRERSVRGQRTWGAAALAAAAAIMLVVWSGRPHRPVAGATAASAAAAPAIESAALVPELDSLDAGELRDVLDAFDAPLSERVIIGPPTIGDLSDQELERVLRAGGV
jgi:hypothetical protein